MIYHIIYHTFNIDNPPYICYTNLAGHNTLYLYINTLALGQKWEVHPPQKPPYAKVFYY